MWQKGSAYSETGSMLPMFLGVLALTILFALAGAMICSSYLFRESVQDAADQLALVAAHERLHSEQLLAPRLALLNETLRLRSLRTIDGRTVELELCGEWASWMRLPGLSSKQTVCAQASAR